MTDGVKRECDCPSTPKQWVIDAPVGDTVAQVSALDSAPSGPSSSTHLSHCTCCVLGKDINSGTSYLSRKLYEISAGG